MILDSGPGLRSRENTHISWTLRVFILKIYTLGCHCSESGIQSTHTSEKYSTVRKHTNLPKFCAPLI